MSKEIIFQAVDMAKGTGLTISFDPNMRYKLWTIVEPRDTFQQLVKKTDIVLLGKEEGELITGSIKTLQPVMVLLQGFYRDT
jgi:2-dehydro-3-deoxygluconokinase